MPRNSDPHARDAARDARKNPSVAEKIMWSCLRSERTGFKFRREHPIDNFRVDLYCAEALLAVEFDGEQHVPEEDARRDARLAEFGILVLRFPNREFFGLEPAVEFRDEIAEIVRLCEERSGRKAF